MTAAELVRMIREEQGGHPGNEYALDEASAVRLLEQDRRDQREWGILKEHQAWTRDLPKLFEELANLLVEAMPDD